MTEVGITREDVERLCVGKNIFDPETVLILRALRDALDASEAKVVSEKRCLSLEGLENAADAVIAVQYRDTQIADLTAALTTAHAEGWKDGREAARAVCKTYDGEQAENIEEDIRALTYTPKPTSD